MATTEATSSIHSSLTFFGFLLLFFGASFALFLFSFRSFGELTLIFSREGMMNGGKSGRNDGGGEGNLG